MGNGTQTHFRTSYQVRLRCWHSLFCSNQVHRDKDGNYGQWCSFAVQIGSPPQDVRLLVSTSTSETVVIVPEGCPPASPPSCASNRGGLFSANSSSTWKSTHEGALALALDLELNLGYTAFARYGLDTASLKVPYSAPVNLSERLIAGIGLDNFCIGYIGMNVNPTNRTDMNNRQPGYLTTLKENGNIPSLSYAYTAGAPYRKSAPILEQIDLLTYP